MHAHKTSYICINKCVQHLIRKRRIAWRRVKTQELTVKHIAQPVLAYCSEHKAHTVRQIHIAHICTPMLHLLTHLHTRTLTLTHMLTNTLTQACNRLVLYYYNGIPVQDIKNLSNITHTHTKARTHIHINIICPSLFIYSYNERLNKSSHQSI